MAGYIERVYFNKSDVDIVVDSLRNNSNVLLLGPAGTGKTSLVYVAGDKLGRRVYYVPCHSGLTVEALIGQYVPRKDGSGFVWMDGYLTIAMKQGAIIYFDELNSARPEVTFYLHGVLDHRRELILLEKQDENGIPEAIQAREGFGVVAAGNPGYEGVRPMNEALRDRFQTQLHMGYITEMDCAIINGCEWAAHLEPEQITAIGEFIGKVRKGSETGGIYSEITTRAFIDLTRNMVLHGFQVARALFCTRFNDNPDEVTFLRQVFSDVWSKDGHPHAAPVRKPNNSGNGRGRAGRFGSNANADTNSMASGVF